MVKEERTGKRDLTYNIWHRTLGEGYYMVDLDCVEWRSDRERPVAIIERSLDCSPSTREEVLEDKRFEIIVTWQVAQALKVPAYLVFYNQELTNFDVYHIKEKHAQFWQTMDNNQYSYFLRQL